MRATIQNNDLEFLEQALKFYRHIDKYSKLLEIDRSEVGAFRNDVIILLFIVSTRDHSFSESFIRYNINLLRTRLEHLFLACMRSKNYNRNAGIELGIIIPWYRSVFPLGWGAQGMTDNHLIVSASK